MLYNLAEFWTHCVNCLLALLNSSHQTTRIKVLAQQSAIKAYVRKIFLDRLITEMFIFVYLLSVFRLETVKNPSHTLCAGVQYLHPHYFWLYDELQANYVGIFELSIWASVINRLATGK